MNHYYVQPLPESTPATPEPDPLLEKFRDDTIKGKKIKGKPHRSIDPGADFSLIDSIAPGPEPAGDLLDWGIDDTDSW